MIPNGFLTPRRSYLTVAIFTILMSTGLTTANGDPVIGDLPRLPICGDQGDGTETLKCADFFVLPEVQTFRVPGDVGTSLAFDFVFREADLDNELAFFTADNMAGEIGGLSPGDAGYMAAALARAVVVFPSGSTASTADVTRAVATGDVLVFFIVQDDTLANLIANNPTNSSGGSPLAFFSLDALNPDGVDHFVGFNRNTGSTVTQLAFEDLTGGGDNDFDDIVYTLPNLDPSPGLKDTDGDGLFDTWETNGLDADGDGVIDVDLPAFGADPNHKDLFLELDFETGEAPSRASVLAVKRAFAGAPLANPDGTTGINLWVDTGGAVDPNAREGQAPGTCTDGLDNGGDGPIDAADPDCSSTPGNRDYLETSVEDPQPGNCADGVDNDGDGDTDGDDPDCLIGDNLGGGGQVVPTGACNLDTAFYNAKAINFNANRALVFRYGLSADLGGCPSSGGWGEIGGNDFIDFNHDGGTLMHEFGHTLNLRHGGNNNDNCKPNYVSVMDYDEQFGINRVGGGAILDYSPPRVAFDGSTRGAAPLDQLQEDDLDDGVRLDATDTGNRFVFVDSTGQKVQTALNAGVNWNSDADPPLESDQQINIDTSGTNGRPSACTNATSTSDLDGHHDWNAISLPFQRFGDAADGAINPVTVPTPTFDDFVAMLAELNTTDLTITKGDSADPIGAGEQLLYTLEVANNGPNPANSVVLTDTLPTEVTFSEASDGCTESSGVVTCNLGELDPDESVVITITVDVPADLVFDNGGPLTITNSVTVENLAGPDPDPSNNEVSEDTLVVVKADLEIVSFTISSIEELAPGEILVGEDVQVELLKQIRNNGPSTPVDTRLTLNSAAPPGSTVTPEEIVRDESALVVDQIREVTETVTIRCGDPSSHTFTVSNQIEAISANAIDPIPANNTADLDIEVECVVPVAINIHPESDPNSINPRSNVPVAVLTVEAGEYGLPIAFDATAIDAEGVRFGVRELVLGGAGVYSPRGHEEDAFELDETTLDGDLDLVLHFRAAGSGLVVGDSEACVKGEWVDASGAVHRFFGCDSVVVVPK